MSSTPLTSWRRLQRASVDEPGPWTDLDTIRRPVGMTHTAVQVWAIGELIPPVTVVLQGTNLSQGAPDVGWVDLGTVTLSPESSTAMFGVGGLVDVTPFRWLRATAVGGPRPCALLVVFDGDILSPKE